MAKDSECVQRQEYHACSLNTGVFVMCGEWRRKITNEASGGEGGIRTPDTVTRMPHFECGAFNHSATSPSHCINGGFRFVLWAKSASPKWSPTHLFPATGYHKPERRVELRYCVALHGVGDV